MVLGYSKKFPDGSPTFFREKIMKQYDNTFDRTKFKLTPDELVEYIRMSDDLHPKIHSIRIDTGKRWRAGRIVQHAYGTRTKNHTQFFESMCTAVQRITIQYHGQVVRVDGEELDRKKLLDLAKNDGFDSIDHFFSWFSEDFVGVIIHWTEKRY